MGRQAGEPNYTEEEKAAALETLNLCGGNLREAARLTGIPEPSVRGWSKGHCVSEEVFTQFALKKQGRMTAKLRALADRLADALASEEKIETARYGELNAAFGTIFDKLRLTDGDPTSITESRVKITLEQAERSLVKFLNIGLSRSEAIESMATVDPERAGVLRAADARVVEGKLVN